MEHDIRADQTRGARAAELLQNELLLEALSAIDKELIEQWTNCPIRDSEGKELFWQLKKTSDNFRKLLLGYFETGKLATNQLKAFEVKRSLKQIFKRA